MVKLAKYKRLVVELPFKIDFENNTFMKKVRDGRCLVNFFQSYKIFSLGKSQIAWGKSSILADQINVILRVCL